GELVERTLAQPGRAPIDHLARDHCNRALPVEKRAVERQLSVVDRDVVGPNRNRLVAVIDDGRAALLQEDRVVIRWTSGELPATARELVGPDRRGGRKAQRPGAARRYPRRQALGRTFDRNVEDGAAHRVAPKRKTLAFRNCISGPGNQGMPIL